MKNLSGVIMITLFTPMVCLAQFYDNYSHPYTEEKKVVYYEAHHKSPTTQNYYPRDNYDVYNVNNRSRINYHSDYSPYYSKPRCSNNSTHFTQPQNRYYPINYNNTYYPAVYYRRPRYRKVCSYVPVRHHRY